MPLRLVLAFALGLFVQFASAQERPRLSTHEALVEEVTRQTSLDVSNKLAVFAFVLGSLAERVKVYPTENYYYFKFVHNHVPYAGNIRLDASDRDEGKVHFGYYEDVSEWRDEPTVNYARLDASDGINVEKVERFLYRVTQGAKSVLFELNDLSGVQPPAGAVADGERFIGPVFDESAIRFFLLYNARLKAFHYVLDETVPAADEFVPARRSDRILVGKRTGFAFYRDHTLDRKILIGVYAGNSHLNNYYDGPFDQLPDNFLEGDTLREIILQVDPRLKGRIDRFGGSFDGEFRYMIAPYLHYDIEDDLLAFHRCATDKRVPAANYANCFVIDPPEESSDRRPRALKQLRKPAAKGR